MAASLRNAFWVSPRILFAKSRMAIDPFVLSLYVFVLDRLLSVAGRSVSFVSCARLAHVRSPWSSVSGPAELA